jgi:hypothetical protein
LSPLTRGGAVAQLHLERYKTFPAHQTAARGLTLTWIFAARRTSATSG